MRRRVVILALAVLAAVSILIVSAVYLTDTQEQVTYSVSNVYGDPTAAHGLTVSVSYTVKDHAYWEVKHTLGEENQTETDFLYKADDMGWSRYTKEKYGVGNTVNALDIRVSDGADWRVYSDLIDDEGLRDKGLVRAYRELNEAQAWDDPWIHYADYCSYYPLEGFFYNSDGDMPHEWEAYAKWNYQDAEKINDYFRIPVLEDDRTYMVPGQSAPEQIRGGADYYEMGAVGVCWNDRVYFTFDAHTHHGNFVDTSMIPGGYGLYMFQVDYTSIQKYTLTTLMELDITHYPKQMFVDEALGHLLYISTLEEKWYLTVIDLNTLQVLQQLCILEDGAVEPWFDIQGDLLYCVQERERIRILQRDDAGIYSNVFEAPIRVEDEQFLVRGKCLAFHGDRLAVAGNLIPEENRYAAITECGYALWIFTQEGLAYAADYTASLGQQPQDTLAKCRIHGLDIFWEST